MCHVNNRRGSYSICFIRHLSIQPSLAQFIIDVSTKSVAFDHSILIKLHPSLNMTKSSLFFLAIISQTYVCNYYVEYISLLLTIYSFYQTREKTNYNCISNMNSKTLVQFCLRSFYHKLCYYKNLPCTFRKISRQNVSR